MQNSEMLLWIDSKDMHGAAIKCRFRLFDIEKDSFNWEMKSSLDDGKTWGGQSGAVIAVRVGA